MVRHLNKKFKCKKRNDILFLDDNTLYNESLIKKMTDIEVKNDTEIKNDSIINIEDDTSNDATNFITNNISNSTEIICDNNTLNCSICNKKYSRRSSLKRHETLCIIKNKEYKESTNNNNNGSINNIQNIQNIHNIQINLNIDGKKIIPFDEMWDTSMLDDLGKFSLFTSKTKFTNTMEKLLENDLNKNVLIEKEKNYGIVYKNENEKFTEMKIKDIIDVTMQKLYIHLNNFYIDIKNNTDCNFNNILLHEKKNLDDKFLNYQNNDNTKKFVENSLSNAFQTVDEETLNLYKAVCLENKNKLDLIDDKY
jgi:hypothetical protein